MNRLLFIVLLLSCSRLFAQTISGVLVDRENNQPIEFANIGIVGRNVGTVSNINGKFNFFVDSKYNKDALLFSIIGYEPKSIEVSDLREGVDNKIALKKKAYEVPEVVVKPKVLKQQTLGIRTKLKTVSAGFKGDDLLGYECGVIIKVKKTTVLKKVNINVSRCSFDTVFYRLNIYKVQGELDFKSILTEPLYIAIPKEQISDEIQIDLQSRNIITNNDLLITAYSGDVDPLFRSY